MLWMTSKGLAKEGLSDVRVEPILPSYVFTEDVAIGAIFTSDGDDPKDDPQEVLYIFSEEESKVFDELEASLDQVDEFLANMAKISGGPFERWDRYELFRSCAQIAFSAGTTK